MGKKISVEFGMKDVEMLHNSRMKSFYYGEGQEGRFILIDESEEGAFKKMLPDKAFDEKCTMMFTEEYLNGKIIVEVLRANGYKAFLFSDEAYREDAKGNLHFEYAVIVDMVFNI